MRRPNDEADFWKLVDFSGHPYACWPWMGHINHKGYGRIMMRGKRTTAHRRALLGEAEKDEPLRVLHRCDNRRCVRLSHLFLGTRQDNNADMVGKGRQAQGARFSFTKLTPEGVREARTLSAAGISQREIGKRLGVTSGAISSLIHGRSWKHVK